jgi:NADH-quinone oxidoreductase subunit C
MEMEHGLEILYHFSDDETGQYYCPRLVIEDKKNPSCNSIVPIVKGAEWIEREIFDFWGINFIDHPRMERLLALHHPENLDKPLRMEEKK